MSNECQIGVREFQFVGERERERAVELIKERYMNHLWLDEKCVLDQSHL